MKVCFRSVPKEQDKVARASARGTRYVLILSFWSAPLTVDRLQFGN